MAASPCSNPPDCTGRVKLGIPARVTLGLTDAVKPVISTEDPFAVRIGICYTDTTGKHPAGTSRSPAAIAPGAATDRISPIWTCSTSTILPIGTPGATETCINLDVQTCFDLKIRTTPAMPQSALGGRPANGVTAIPTDGACTHASVQGTDAFDRPACIFPKDQLTKLDCKDTAKNCVAQLTPADKKFYYDQASGMLYFWVVQDAPNFPVKANGTPVFGPSPLGSCHNPKEAGDDPSCPDIAAGESYYACPPRGASTTSSG